MEYSTDYITTTVYLDDLDYYINNLLEDDPDSYLNDGSILCDFDIKRQIDVLIKTMKEFIEYKEKKRNETIFLEDNRVEFGENPRINARLNLLNADIFQLSYWIYNPDYVCPPPDMKELTDKLITDMKNFIDYINNSNN